MLVGTIDKIATKGFFFVKSEGTTFFAHYSSVQSTSEVAFTDARVGDTCEFEADFHEAKGPRITCAYITARPEGERLRGTIVQYSPRGFAFVNVGRQDYYLHASACNWPLADQDTGATIEFSPMASDRGRPCCLDAVKIEEAGYEEPRYEEPRYEQEENQDQDQAE